jgi:hypothetical protein
MGAKNKSYEQMSFIHPGKVKEGMEHTISERIKGSAARWKIILSKKKMEKQFYQQQWIQLISLV